MQKSITYIGFYDHFKNNKRRIANIAAIRKMDYVADAFQRAGFFVRLISPSWLNQSLTLQLFKEIPLSKKTNLILLPSINLFGKYTMGLTKFISLFSLFVWLIINTKKNEIIWVYHSYFLSIPLRFAKKIKKFKIVLEIGEIYSEVWNLKKRHKNWEDNLLNTADYFVPASKLLAEQLDKDVLTIYHGDYRTIKTNRSFNPDKINIVYAGSIDEVKSGAYKAIETALYLPNNYTIHIAGYGSNYEVKKLKERINQINNKKKKEICIYHGVLEQNELTNLLSKCEIALNPQIIGSYMDSAFPTKILTYLAHGLIILSSKIKSIVESEFKDTLIFIEDEDPKIIANKIEEIKITKHNDGKKLLERLDERFVQNIKDFYSHKYLK